MHKPSLSVSDWTVVVPPSCLHSVLQLLLADVLNLLAGSLSLSAQLWLPACLPLCPAVSFCTAVSEASVSMPGAPGAVLLTTAPLSLSALWPAAACAHSPWLGPWDSAYVAGSLRAELTRLWPSKPLGICLCDLASCLSVPRDCLGPCWSACPCLSGCLVFSNLACLPVSGPQTPWAEPVHLSSPSFWLLSCSTRISLLWSAWLCTCSSLAAGSTPQALRGASTWLVSVSSREPLGLPPLLFFGGSTTAALSSADPTLTRACCCAGLRGCTGCLAIFSLEEPNMLSER